jgi:hypothetical protein
MPIANTVWYVAGSSGLSDFSDGTALTGMRNIAAAAAANGLTNGAVYSYRAEHPTDKSIWENGSGAVDTGTGVVARTTIAESSSGTSKINFAVAPVILLTGMKRDADAVDAAIAARLLTASALSELSSDANSAAARGNIRAALDTFNVAFAESHAANALTISVKTRAGTDPSASNPASFYFRNGNATNGAVVERRVTAALSVTLSAGSTAGFVNGQGGKLWVGALDNGGTVELFVINCRDANNNIYPLGQFPLINTTAEGGAGGADNAWTAYAAASRVLLPYVILGYLQYESGLATAGTWNVSPSRVQPFGPNVPLPGQSIQATRFATGTVATGTAVMPADNTIPQNTEGTQFMSLAIAPTSSSHVLRVRSQIVVGIGAAVQVVTAALFQDSVANALTAVSKWLTSPYQDVLNIEHWMLAGAGSLTLKVRAGYSNGSDTVTFNGEGGNQFFGGAYNSYLAIEEIAT